MNDRKGQPLTIEIYVRGTHRGKVASTSKLHNNLITITGTPRQIMRLAIRTGLHNRTHFGDIAAQAMLKAARRELRNQAKRKSVNGQ